MNRLTEILSNIPLEEQLPPYRVFSPAFKDRTVRGLEGGMPAQSETILILKDAILTYLDQPAKTTTSVEIITPPRIVNASGDTIWPR